MRKFFRSYGFADRDAGPAFTEAVSSRRPILAIVSVFRRCLQKRRIKLSVSYAGRTREGARSVVWAAAFALIAGAASNVSGEGGVRYAGPVKLVYRVMVTPAAGGRLLELMGLPLNGTCNGEVELRLDGERLSGEGACAPPDRLRALFPNAHFKAAIEGVVSPERIGGGITIKTFKTDWNGRRLGGGKLQGAFRDEKEFNDLRVSGVLMKLNVKIAFSGIFKAEPQGDVGSR